jgi:hypothetical protein
MRFYVLQRNHEHPSETRQAVYRVKKKFGAFDANEVRRLKPRAEECAIEEAGCRA